MTNKYYKIGITFMVLAVVFTIMGGTLAYWNWQSSTAQKTEVTFTVGSNFSCGANGGGNLTSNAYFAPTTCDNSTYALKRTITTSITNNGTDPVYMDLWLNVVSMGEGLRNSDNFKYALTTSESSCTTGVEASGTFKGKANGSKVELLSGVTSGSTYYLYIWLDAAEESQSTMNQSVNLTLGGSCTNEVSSEQTVYTVNLYDESKENNNSVIIGSQISNTITQYSTPEAAITALETAYSNANSGATASLPFYLKHTVGDYSGWCIIMNNDTSNCLYSAPTETDCNTVLSQGTPDDGNAYTCSNITASNAVTESYVGFVVTPAMATANPGMVAGTYYLKGGDNGTSFLDNAKTIYDAFGGVGCYLDGNSGGNPYTTTPSSYFSCRVPGLNASAGSRGNVGANDDAGSICRVVVSGYSHCGVSVDGGGGE